MTPIVHGLQEEFEGRATVLRLDAARPENGRLQQSYGLRGHPTFAILDGEGRVVERLTGLQPAERLRAVLTAVAG